MIVVGDRGQRPPQGSLPGKSEAQSFQRFAGTEPYRIVALQLCPACFLGQPRGGIFQVLMRGPDPLDDNLKHLLILTNLRRRLGSNASGLLLRISLLEVSSNSTANVDPARWSWK